ncbi:MAG: sigma 54-interacting transcriptional regulator [Bacillota bacterium]|nr:sigma 54-interacting transcriptional regulator [Bacillota bacterium]MDW7676256.1 sigma 54-interacting transcriptional regulator [Bacillota bacterium]
MSNAVLTENRSSGSHAKIMKDYIQRSHARSMEYGVELGRIYSSKILKGKELDRKMAENRELIETSSPFLKQLCDFVKGSGFFAILTDWEGCILDIQGDEGILLEATRLEMIPGAFMHEKHIGTNAMGTALAEKIPVQVDGEEHYVTAYHRWTCSAAPIRDPKGKIIGTLDLTGKSHLVHSHTLGMVVAAVNAIEQMLTIRQANQKLELARNSISTIIDSITAGIFTVGPRGYIKTINKTAGEMLGYTQKETRGLHISDVVENWDTIRRDLDKGINFTEEELDVSGKNGKIRCSFSTYPVEFKDGKHQGVVCVLKEAKKIRKIAHKMAGSRAVYTFDKIVGRNQKFLKLIDNARRVANSPSTVLITGESGVGKEVFAQALHNASERADEAFVAINCGAIPRNLIEAELFGYEDGAFTGAKRGGKLGKFEWADGGTLFLDEIGEMPYDMQTNLLRVLETGKLFRVGGNQEMDVDVRIIAATNKDLRTEVEKGNFRRDLYYRLNVVPLELMPLRERKDDISLLIDYFITVKSMKLGKNPVNLSQAQLQQMAEYPWPGNIRELENTVEQIINLNTCRLWESEWAPEDSGDTQYQQSEIECLEEMERRHIEKVYRCYNGNVSLTAEALGIGRNTFYRKAKKYHIDCSKV